ncbi:MAG: tyrosine--tRNA ligase [Anaerolineae bacterium]
MSAAVFETLKARGFVQQCTDEAAVRELLDGGPVTFYNGFDCTAASLHAGHLVPIMAMMHLQRAGHRPIVLLGGGTTLIGDPTGKDETRRMVDEATVRGYAEAIFDQLDRFLGVRRNLALGVNNADWLLDLRYLPFLREIGRHFSVNRMLSAETYRVRLEREAGLSFIELNYQILQAYDFLHLHRQEGCLLQTGGDDQWSNILAGVDLVRRLEGARAQAMTYSLLTTADGRKMGKTEKGALWLDAAMTSPYDYYQYWVNCQDEDLPRLLRLMTFLPLEEVEALDALEGAARREAKQVLAFEQTRIVHGDEAAGEARAAAQALFSGGGGDLAAMPSAAVSAAELAEGLRLTEALVRAGLARSNAEARQKIAEGAVWVNERQATDALALLRQGDVGADGIMLRLGKKRFARLTVG